MGGCTSDTYGMVKNKHGELFQKYIVGSESFPQFKMLVQNKKKQYNSKSQEKKLSILSQLNKKEKTMTNHFNEVKANLSKQLPEGITNFERVKKDSLENILGLQQYKKRLLGVQDQALKDINQRKQQTNQQFDEIVRNAEEEYTINPQDLKFITRHSQQKRAMIHNRGVQQFAEQIKKRLQDLKAKNSQILDIDLQVSKLNSIISMQRVDHLVNMAKNKFKSQSINATGGFIDSDIVV